MLKEYYPAFLNCFQDPFSPSAWHFLQKYPAQEQACKLSRRELRIFFKNIHIYPESFVQRVYDGLRTYLQVRPVLVETRSYLARVLAPQLLQIRELVREHERQLEKAT